MIPGPRSVAAVTAPRRTDGVEGVERLDQATLRRRLREHSGVASAFALRTCQRVELYAEGPDARRDVDDVATALGLTDGVAARTIGRGAVEHLYRVASGLESVVLGEDEVLGQVRQARVDAREDGTLEGDLEEVVRSAIGVGERVRSETAIGDGHVSIGTIAVDRAAAALDGLADATVVVLGAGDVASLVVDALAAEDVGEVVLGNRSLSAARSLAATIDGRARPLSALEDAIDDADLLVAATGAPEPVLERVDLANASLVAIDLATPPDVAPEAAGLPGVRRLDLDDLRETWAAEHDQRRGGVPEAERILEEELDRLARSLRARTVDDAIGRLHRRAATVQQREVDRAVARLEAEGECSPAVESVLEALASSLTASLLHEPTTAIREAAADGDEDAARRLLEAFGVRATDPEHGASTSALASDDRQDEQSNRTDDGRAVDASASEDGSEPASSGAGAK